ncbi:MAG: hypothetical protein V8R08_03185 [Coriobacteriales bacterium]
MSIVVPPAPSQESAPAIMERLARLSQDEAPEGQRACEMRQPRALLIASCLLSAGGMLLLICAIAVTCTPHAALSQVVFLVCETLL